ncbi:MAG: DUF3299 domain-containing protein [Fuerstiella sp.]|nr:DUF3299 domain-containing protein [Fuerstiella sp.]
MRSHSSTKWYLLRLILSAATVGCSDSQSDDFVKFENLDSGTAAVAQEQHPEASKKTTNDPTVENEPIIEAADAVDVDNDSVATTPVHDSTVQSEEPDKRAGPVDTDSKDPAAMPVVDSENAKPIMLLIPHRQFRKEGTAFRVTFDDIDLLKILNMEPVPVDAPDHFPDWLSNLNGAHVRIRGYMRPGYETEDITEFLFVRDNGECCYGPIPKIYDMIAVTLKDDESTDLIEGTPFDVEGTLRIEPHADEVDLYALFFIDNGVITE